MTFTCSFNRRLFPKRTTSEFLRGKLGRRHTSLVVAIRRHRLKTRGLTFNRSRLIIDREVVDRERVGLGFGLSARDRCDQLHPAVLGRENVFVSSITIENAMKTMKRKC